ncbi:hypothetical protein F5890DRAFT_1478742 [Lentinula detonsa]|uniref:Uncharacterized protein n=1 Tax=Lentinula detonsa TaxID=2804962 RepID=A0AA38UPK8_9AGAR|nr:hypothetical protein F5890DRAFT_1478742 [Lentinula detonsa]
MCSNDTHSHIPAFHYSRTETTIVPPTLRTPIPLRRSNIPDRHGFHDWSEYQLQPIHSTPFLHPSTLSLGLTDAFVDVTAMVTTFPRDLCLRWVFQDPNSGDTKVLYGRDTELRWTEVIAGARSGIVPARYVTRIAPDATLRGPMTREWFLNMVSQFSVSKEGDPNSGDTKVLYGRDTELRWTEVIAGARSGIVPARYVTRIAPDATLRGPMTREWFLDMVSQFLVSKCGIWIQ